MSRHKSIVHGPNRKGALLTGPSKFLLYGHVFKRFDLQITNPQGLRIGCGLLTSTGCGSDARLIPGSNLVASRATYSDGAPELCTRQHAECLSSIDGLLPHSCNWAWLFIVSFQGFACVVLCHVPDYVLHAIISAAILAETCKKIN